VGQFALFILITNPVIFTLFLIAVIFIGIPLFVQVLGLGLTMAFVFLTMTLTVDFLFELVFDPSEVSEYGTFTGLLMALEGEVSQYLGPNLTSIIGKDILKDLVDNWHFHFLLQVLVILPLTLLLTAFKALVTVAGIVLFIFGIIMMLFNDPTG